MQSKQGRNVKCGHSDSHMSEVLNSEEAFSVGAGRLIYCLSFDGMALGTCHYIYLRAEGSLTHELGAQISAS